MVQRVIIKMSELSVIRLIFNPKNEKRAAMRVERRRVSQGKEAA
ncbi:hypothetical protein [Pseudodesulfovibrio pelocollis]|nr:hypothetical protein [Pseudodesulfovibrio sp. SB368]